MRLPLRSATVLTEDRDSTDKQRFEGGPYMAATPIAGTPFARKPSPGPEPTATSMAPAVSACCICASPRKADTASSRPSCSQILLSMPISAVLKAKEFGTDLANRSLSSAKARRADSITRGDANAPLTTLRREILRINILLDVPRRHAGNTARLRARLAAAGKCSNLRLCRPRAPQQRLQAPEGVASSK